MGLFTGISFDSLECLLVEQLQDLYDAEHRLLEALPKMADAAKSPQLAAAFREHHGETERQIQRLERVFEIIGKDAKRKTCDAMKGLVSEGEEVINASGSDEVRDAALIAAAQRVEHYEMAGYGSVRNFAQRLDLTEAVALLQETLDEEGGADQKLTTIAESSINAQAASA